MMCRKELIVTKWMVQQIDKKHADLNYCHI